MSVILYQQQHFGMGLWLFSYIEHFNAQCQHAVSWRREQSFNSALGLPAKQTSHQASQLLMSPDQGSLWKFSDATGITRAFDAAFAALLSQPPGLLQCNKGTQMLQRLPTALCPCQTGPPSDI